MYELKLRSYNAYYKHMAAPSEMWLPNVRGYNSFFFVYDVRAVSLIAMKTKRLSSLT